MVPDVSVIVPIYNVEELLPKCLRSIINQSLKNIEIILVNDGSTDSSGNICERFAEKDNRIKIIHKKNGGLSDARNAGLDIATGRYIGFVDSDDYIHKDMYKILLEAIVSHECDIAEGGYKEVYADEVISQESILVSEKIYEKKSALVSAIVDHHCRTYVWNKLYKRELWKDIRFPYGKLFEDTFTTYKVINQSSKIIKLDRTLYYYYQRENSIVNSKFTVRKLDQHEALDEMMQFIEEEYHEFAPITCIKYFSQSLNNLQEVLINRKNIDNSNVLIDNLSKALVEGKFNKYLREDIKIRSKLLLNADYEFLIKQKKVIKLRLFLIRNSIWYFYFLNNLVTNMKLSLKSVLKIAKSFKHIRA
ncbi:glycosyltransferase family 2 protein [Priestia megaterium]|uniref:glycosyltransferase family 2 protein n=1 Tax=Priestia megaterium TaxID=1404 RepID=UPI002E1F262D|nr:glycosyltransferase [Priestia megaterium]